MGWVSLRSRPRCFGGVHGSLQYLRRDAVDLRTRVGGKPWLEGRRSRAVIPVCLRAMGGCRCSRPLITCGFYSREEL